MYVCIQLATVYCVVVQQKWMHDHRTHSTLLVVSAMYIHPLTFTVMDIVQPTKMDCVCVWIDQPI